MSGASRLIPLPSCIMLLPAGAHFWRSGQPGLAAACIVLAALAWSRAAWVRLLLLLLLPLLAVRWVWSTGQFVQMRMLMGEPWHRLAVILLTVALLTALSTWPLLREAAQQRYHKGEATARTQLAALFLCIALLLPVWIMKPQLLVLERFLPQWGSLQLALAGMWAALAAGWLSSKKSPQLRMRLWRLFSLVFFAQLVLGLLLESRFLLSGQLHLPVPGLIAAAPVYRGGGWFMLGLFTFSTLLAGAAWCSHLCYFGAWDATAAKACAGGPRGLVRMDTSVGAPAGISTGTFGSAANMPAQQAIPRRAPAWLPHLRLVMLVLTLGIPLSLRLGGAPIEAALAGGLLLGRGSCAVHDLLGGVSHGLAGALLQGTQHAAKYRAGGGRSGEALGRRAGQTVGGAGERAGRRIALRLPVLHLGWPARGAGRQVLAKDLGRTVPLEQHDGHLVGL